MFPKTDEGLETDVPASTFVTDDASRAPLHPAASAKIASAFERLRPALTTYLTRLVLRPAVAEELLQTTFTRALEAASVPVPDNELRPWLYRIATNLAIDEVRKQSVRQESLISDLRELAESRPAFLAAAAGLRGSPETVAVAREHLVFCFACTLRQFPPEQAAALLLKEVYGLTIEETAEVLGARFAQVKNWVGGARAAMEARYDRTCALVAKEGVCHQCVELDAFYGSGQGSPLGDQPTVRTRLQVLQESRTTPAGRWTEMLAELLGELA